MRARRPRRRKARAAGPLLALVLSGVLTLREGLAGYGDPVIILMGGLLVVGEALVEALHQPAGTAVVEGAAREAA